MQKDSIVFIVTIICLCILGIMISAVEISPDRLGILRGIIDILAVVLGVSGRGVAINLIKRLRRK